MRKLIDIKRRLNDAFLPGVFLLLIVYFGYHAIQGELGLISWLKTEKEITALEIEAAQLAQQRNNLERRVALMSPRGGVDPDLLDEQARFVLGFAHPDEIVIYTDPAP